MTVKRLFDFLVSSLALIPLGPILLIVAAIIRLDGGPALYRSSRAGREGEPFVMMKFRSMVPDVDRIGPISTAKEDARVTRIGRLLRAYKLDELPQLINVFRGEMSLVGPRPEVLSEVETYDDFERGVLRIRPGMTDYSSILYRNEGEIISGHDDPHEAYRRLIKPNKILLGLYYIRSQSLTRDLSIIAVTLSSLFNPDIGTRWAEKHLDAARKTVATESKQN